MFRAATLIQEHGQAPVIDPVCPFGSAVANFRLPPGAAPTPQFAANFRSDSSSLGSVLTRYKAGSTGSVSGAGVGPVSLSRATVYVFLDEKVANSKESGTTERARMVVTLVRHGGRWLIANAVVQ